MFQKFRAYRKDSKYGLAIVTGGSSGIGNSIIEQIATLGLAPRVFNLSRTNPVSFSIGPNLRHLECDLSDRRQRNDAFSLLEHELDRLGEVGPILLVNNAGYGGYGCVHERSAAEELRLIEVNVAAVVELTARLLPKMKRSGGAIVTIASTAAFQPTPFFATYGAAKAFVLNWTLALNEELRGVPQLRACVVCPGPTRTRFFRNAGLPNDAPSGHSQEASAVTAALFAALASKRPLAVPGWRNKIAAAVSSRLPRPFSAWIAGRVIGRFRLSHP